MLILVFGCFKRCHKIVIEELYMYYNISTTQKPLRAPLKRIANVKAKNTENCFVLLWLAILPLGIVVGVVVCCMG